MNFHSLTQKDNHQCWKVLDTGKREPLCSAGKKLTNQVTKEINMDVLKKLKIESHLTLP